VFELRFWQCRTGLIKILVKICFNWQIPSKWNLTNKLWTCCQIVQEWIETWFKNVKQQRTNCDQVQKSTRSSNQLMSCSWKMLLLKNVKTIVITSKSWRNRRTFGVLLLKNIVDRQTINVIGIDDDAN
jgi:hypothetical protein